MWKQKYRSLIVLNSLKPLFLRIDYDSLYNQLVLPSINKPWMNKYIFPPLFNSIFSFKRTNVWMKNVKHASRRKRNKRKKKQRLISLPLFVNLPKRDRLLLKILPPRRFLQWILQSRWNPLKEEYLLSISRIHSFLVSCWSSSTFSFFCIFPLFFNFILLVASQGANQFYIHQYIHSHR